MKIAFIISDLVNKGPVLVVYELVNELVLRGHQCVVFYFGSKTEVKFDCTCIKIDFRDILDFTDFDVVHSHGVKPDYYIYRNRKYFKSTILTVSTIHNYALQDFKCQYNIIVAYLLYRTWMYLLSSHSKIVTLSKNAYSYYEKWFDNAKLEFVYNSRTIDLSNDISLREKEQISLFKEHSILIGVNALLTPVKGIDLLIKALVYLPSYKLCIVGDGKSRKDLFNLAIDLGVDDRCLFLGYKKDAYRFIKYYDIFALPSKSEGFPLALLEAAAYGCPTVASNLPIIEEAFTSEEISIFDINQPLTIIDAIKNATNNKMMSFKFVKKYKENYNSSIMCDKYIQIYEKKV